MKAKILWIEGKRAEGQYFVPDLRKKDFTVEIVSTGKAALGYLSKDKCDLVILNAASYRTSGKRICQDIRGNWAKLPIVMIANPNKPVSKDVGADVLLELPFTIRKLVNRLCGEVRQQALPLVDAFDIPDELLAAPIAI